MVFPHRLPRDHDAGAPNDGGAAPIPVYGWDLSDQSADVTTPRSAKNKVMAGGTPANPAAQEVRLERQS